METGREVAISYTISEDVAIACAPTATRTRDLLLRRHYQSVPGRCWTWPDVPFQCSEIGWAWPGVALWLWSLAPSLAPRNIVSSANVRMRQADTGPIRGPQPDRPDRPCARRRLPPTRLPDRQGH